MSPTPRKPSSASSAEKRVLWEISKRYQVDKNKPRRTTGSKVQPSSAAPPGGKKPPLSRQPIGGPKPKSNKSKHWGRRVALILVLVLALSSGIFGYKILAAGNKISVADRSLLGQLKDLLLSSGQQLEGETDGRINIMLLAIGGEGHSGENLADTIIVASVKPNPDGPSDVAMLSIPRDLYVQVPGEEYYTKINAVHAYGEQQEEDHGPEVLREKVEEITGLPIHYYLRADFTAFKHIVDALGGINITIDNSFFDYWHKISFPAGTEEMNGERALAYVRARYIEGPEGGDFKRAARQQQVLLAIRDKAFSVQTALDFTAINSIINSLSDNIRTDMHIWEMKRFFEMARSIDQSAVGSVVLTTGPNGVLVGGTEVLGGVPASILKPRTGDYSEIQSIAGNIFEVSDKNIVQEADTTLETPEPTPEEEVEEEKEEVKPTIEIRNGTNVTGLASRTSDDLESDGYEVLTIGNASNRTTEKTTVYALDSEFTDSAKALAENMGAQADSGLPSEEPASSADVLIILGADAE